MTSASGLFTDSAADWRLERSSYLTDEDAFYESLFALSNGTIGVRATVDFPSGGGRPGCFCAGLYGPGLTVPRQIVNCLNPCWVCFRVGGVPVSLGTADVVLFRQWLDIATAHAGWHAVLQDVWGGTTFVEVRTVVPATSSGVVVCEARLQALDHNRDLLALFGVDWSQGNGDLGGTHPAIRMHLLSVDSVSYTPDRLTVAAHVRGPGASVSTVCSWKTDGATLGPLREAQRGGIVVSDAHSGSLRLVWVATTTVQTPECMPQAYPRMAAMAANDAPELLRGHLHTWRERWLRAAEVDGPASDVVGLRYSMFQTLQATPHAADECNCPARGLTSEYHSGHFFFNSEFYLLPYLLLTEPAKAQAMLRWRVNRLDAAIEHGRSTGFAGARFPEESDDLGRPAAPREIRDVFLGTTTREWSGDEVVHLSADVLYTLRAYLQVTADMDFVRTECVPLIVECARYLSDLLKFDPSVSGFGARCVMGFDEFHYHVDHHFGTNFLASRMLNWAVTVLDRLSEKYPSVARALESKDAGPAARGRWLRVAHEVHLPPTNADGVIPVFKGYFELPDQLRIEPQQHALPDLTQEDHDRATALSTFSTQLVKQADVVFVMLLFPDEFDDRQLLRNLAYYEPRTVHDSSLSPSAHAIAAARVGDLDLALHLFRASARYNLDFRPRENYANGVHVAAYAGAWLTLMLGFLGFGDLGDSVCFVPRLPRDWRRLSVNFVWRNCAVSVTATHTDVLVSNAPSSGQELRVSIGGSLKVVLPGTSATWDLGPDRLSYVPSILPGHTGEAR